MKILGKRACALTFVAMLAAACETVETTQPGVVGVNRPQRVFSGVPRDALNQEASLQYRQTLQQAQAKGLLNRDAELNGRVQRVAQRLIPQTAVFRPDARDWKWEANVISSKELNAWVMPGGKIAVYSGLVEQLRLTDDELAAVMGHEIAHALREHAWERASNAAGAGLLLSIGGALAGAGSGTMDLAGVAYQAMFELPNSRGHETEADRIGIELMARAGYDPRAAVSLWQKMGAQTRGGPPEFLSTHPANERRLADLQEYGQRVMPLYEAARRR